MIKILTGFNKTQFDSIYCPKPDWGEKIGNFSLGLLRLAIGKTVNVKIESFCSTSPIIQCSYSSIKSSLPTRISAIFIAVILLPLTLLLTLVGAVGVCLSKSYDITYIDYKKWYKNFTEFWNIAPDSLEA